MSQSQLLLDFLKEMWVIQYYKIVIAITIFWIIYCKARIPVIVDFAWTFNHLLLGALIYGYKQYNAEEFNQWAFFQIFFLFIWFTRLGGFIFIERVLKSHMDPRYEDLAKGYNPELFYFIQYQFQAILVMITATPLYFMFQNSFMSQNSQLFQALYVIGNVTVIVGIIGEAVADEQLQTYKNNKKLGLIANTSSNIFQSGIWTYSRHPNLFFELVTWMGFALMGISENPYSLFTLIGPISLLLIMNYVTLPVTEEYMKKTRPQEWEEYEKRTNKFLPFNLK